MGPKKKGAGDKLSNLAAPIRSVAAATTASVQEDRSSIPRSLLYSDRIGPLLRKLRFLFLGKFDVISNVSGTGGTPLLRGKGRNQTGASEENQTRKRDFEHLGLRPAQSRGEHGSKAEQGRKKRAVARRTWGARATRM